jgi:hypothetical protein
LQFSSFHCNILAYHLISFKGFDTFINGIYLYFVCRNKTNSCTLTSYPATLLYSLIKYIILSSESSEILKYTNQLWKKWHNFLFLILRILICFSGFIAFGRKRMFIRSGNMGRIPRWRLEVGSRKRASYSEILERHWRHTLQA